MNKVDKGFVFTNSLMQITLHLRKEKIRLGGRVLVLSTKIVINLLRTFKKLNKNIDSAVSKILRYTHIDTHTSCYFNVSIFGNYYRPQK